MSGRRPLTPGRQQARSIAGLSSRIECLLPIRHRLAATRWRNRDIAISSPRCIGAGWAPALDPTRRSRCWRRSAERVGRSEIWRDTAYGPQRVGSSQHDFRRAGAAASVSERSPMPESLGVRVLGPGLTEAACGTFRTLVTRDPIPSGARNRGAFRRKPSRTRMSRTKCVSGSGRARIQKILPVCRTHRSVGADGRRDRAHCAGSCRPGGRANFVAVFATGLIESELFEHVAGATSRKGKHFSTNRPTRLSARSQDCCACPASRSTVPTCERTSRRPTRICARSRNAGACIIAQCLPEFPGLFDKQYGTSGKPATTSPYPGSSAQTLPGTLPRTRRHRRAERPSAADTAPNSANGPDAG